jgi:redox-sensitive bicupin YhaK (pirin superfamily)
VIEVRRGVDRFVTRAEGHMTWHSFSFGSHYDPGNVGFGPLFALNDERLPPGTGYPRHPHADVEIVSWVRSGALRHSSELGERVLPAGSVQRLSAGRGLHHSEVAEGPTGTRFLQAWLRPDRIDQEPSYASAEVSLSEAWTRLVSGDGSGPVSVGVAGAALQAVRLRAGQAIDLPEAPLLHVFVTAGRVQLGERALDTDDAARLTDEPGRTLTAGVSAEVLVWSFARS